MMNNTFGNIGNIMKMATALRSNPSQYLGQLGVPGDIMNDPKAVIQHLMNNGSITQDQYNNAVNIASSMGIHV